jgi:asparagine synthase (glutamine-hydrolysing)
VKNGFLYLAFSYLLPSLENLKHRHDSSTNRIVTGHGGEIIRADPLRIQIKDMDTLVKIIIQGTGSFSLNDVSDLVQIKKSEIVDEIRNTLSSYPEKDLNKKFMHFLYCEIEPKLAFETEDLYRFYFWTTSPYYSIPFFIYAMNCPDENKSKDALYREFLVMLSPSAAAISMSNWGCSILSKKYKFLQFIYSLMWRYLRFYRIIVSILSFMWKHPKLNRIMIKKDNRFYKDNSRIIRCIREQIKSCHNISNYLSCITTEKILNNYSNLSRVGIYKLFTITLLIEKTFCNNNTIDKCYDD